MLGDLLVPGAVASDAALPRAPFSNTVGGMPRPWNVVDTADTEDGLLELRQRGDDDFMILVAGRVLMTSMIATSERALAEQTCGHVAHLSAPRVLVGGLGLGMTLRAALDLLPPGAHVDVAELNEKVIEWARGPAAAASEGAALDRRVNPIHADVTRVIRDVADNPQEPRWDVIIWDLYVGPKTQGGLHDRLYGTRSSARTFDALAEDGLFGVWGEGPSPAYLDRLRKAGFDASLVRTGGGGLHHAIFLAQKGREFGDSRRGQATGSRQAQTERRGSRPADDGRQRHHADDGRQRRPADSRPKEHSRSPHGSSGSSRRTDHGVGRSVLDAPLRRGRR